MYKIYAKFNANNFKVGIEGGELQELRSYIDLT